MHAGAYHNLQCETLFLLLNLERPFAHVSSPDAICSSSCGPSWVQFLAMRPDCRPADVIGWNAAAIGKRRLGRKRQGTQSEYTIHKHIVHFTNVQFYGTDEIQYKIPQYLDKSMFILQK